MLPAIVLSRGCKEPSHRLPSKSTRTINELKKLISEGAILVVGRGFLPHFHTIDENLSEHQDLHHDEIRDLFKFAHNKNRVWRKEDIPSFVTDEKPNQKVFKYLSTIFVQTKECAGSSEWETLAFRKGFNIEGYDIEIRTLSTGAENIPTSFSISINQGDPIDRIGHHLTPLIHWCSSITIYDGYSVERHSNSLKNKGQVSGLSNLFRWIVDERKEMDSPLNRIRVISRQRGKNDDIRAEMKQVFGNLVNDSELETVVKSNLGIDTGIFLGFRADKMGDRLVVFERNGYSLTYSFGHEGIAMLESTRRKKRVMKNFVIEGPVPFMVSGVDGPLLISDMNKHGKFSHYPFT